MKKIYFIILLFYLALFCKAQTVTTITGGSVGSTDDYIDMATFNGPNGLAIDAPGNLYVADYLNQRIRKIDLSTNMVSTFAGTSLGFQNGNVGVAQLNQPLNIAFDKNGNMYVADFYELFNS